MSAKAPTERAAAAVAELQQAAVIVRSTSTPTPVDRAVVAVLEATAAYWRLWFPASPTDMDRAALELARAVLAQTPDAAAGPLPHPTEPHTKGAPT